MLWGLYHVIKHQWKAPFIVRGVSVYQIWTCKWAGGPVLPPGSFWPCWYF